MLALDESDFCHMQKIGVSLGMLQLSVHFSDKNTVSTAGMPASS